MTVVASIACLAILASVGWAAKPASPPGQAKKAAVCHKGRKTLRISVNAVAAHLAHGDTSGACAGATAKSNGKGKSKAPKQDSEPDDSD